MSSTLLLFLSQTVSKIIRLLGKDVTEKVFLEHYTRLCTDVSFHVRRVCAANFGEFCTVVGRDLTETVLVRDRSHFACVALVSHALSVTDDYVLPSSALSQLPQFKSLCEDGIWGVRKACADVFVPVSCVCSNQVRRQLLGPLFVSLLCDGSKWVSACAHRANGLHRALSLVRVAVSLSYEPSHQLIHLLAHPTQVKTAAFQALGPFISTFADPEKTGLYYNDGGVIVTEDVTNAESTSSDDSSTSVASERENAEQVQVDQESEECRETHPLLSYVDSLSLNEFNRVPPEDQNVFEQFYTPPGKRDQSSAGDASTLSSAAKPHQSQPENNAFSAFQYWRLPIAEIPTEITELAGCNELSHLTESAHQARDSEMLELNSNDECLISESEKNSTISLQLMSSSNSLNINQTGSQEEDSQSFVPSYFNSENSKISILGKQDKTVNSSFETNAPFYYSPNMNSELLNDSFSDGRSIRSFFPGSNPARKALSNQDIIPNDLLEHYLSMTNPVNYQTVDQDLTHHCAYSLPAVALTLGRKHWPCLKETYEQLASDMQWKVRWTLASSLHQMALILGPDFTTRDLLPVFLSFMRDLDEVRFGILQHLAAILRLLNRPEQLGIMPKISEFLKMDNNRNWRFRYTLSEQIADIASLYSPADIKEHFLPIAFTLLKDKVAEVRSGAIKLLSTLARHFFCDNSSTEAKLLDEMTKELVSEVTLVS